MEIIRTFVLMMEEVRYASFFSSGFITAIVVNPLERKLAKRTSHDAVECGDLNIYIFGYLRLK